MGGCIPICTQSNGVAFYAQFAAAGQQHGVVRVVCARLCQTHADHLGSTGDRNKPWMGKRLIASQCVNIDEVRLANKPLKKHPQTFIHVGAPMQSKA